MDKKTDDKDMNFNQGGAESRSDVRDESPSASNGSDVPALPVPADVVNEIVSIPEVEIELPEGYTLDDAGLWFDGEKSESPELISGPFRVLGETRDKGSTGWGIAIELGRSRWADPLSRRPAQRLNNVRPGRSSGPCRLRADAADETGQAGPVKRSPERHSHE